MRDLVILFLHLIVTLMRLARPGGIRSLVAESVLVKHQVLILNRSRKRAPNLHASDRIIAGLCVLLMRPARVVRSAIVLRPSTLFHLHHVLVKRKYRLLFSPKLTGKSGPNGPETELIEAIVQMKGRNPTWGCPRICAADYVGLRQFRSITGLTLQRRSDRLGHLPRRCLAANVRRGHTRLSSHCLDGVHDSLSGGPFAQML